jgi:hypothetical protein
VARCPCQRWGLVAGQGWAIGGQPLPPPPGGFPSQIPGKGPKRLPYKKVAKSGWNPIEIQAKRVQKTRLMKRCSTKIARRDICNLDIVMINEMLKSCRFVLRLVAVCLTATVATTAAHAADCNPGYKLGPDRRCHPDPNGLLSFSQTVTLDTGWAPISSLTLIQISNSLL